MVISRSLPSPLLPPPPRSTTPPQITVASKDRSIKSGGSDHPPISRASIQTQKCFATHFTRMFYWHWLHCTMAKCSRPNQQPSYFQSIKKYKGRTTKKDAPLLQEGGVDLGQQGQRRRSGFILFLLLLRFLDFQPSIYVWASFLFFSRRTDIYSITALSYLFKHHSCPSDCQTQIMIRVDLHISRLNTSLKRRKICRSSEREK